MSARGKSFVKGYIRAVQNIAEGFCIALTYNHIGNNAMVPP